MLHQLAIPDPGFDPADKITALLESLVRPGRQAPRHPDSARHGGTESAPSSA